MSWVLRMKNWVPVKTVKLVLCFHTSWPSTVGRIRHQGWISVGFSFSGWECLADSDMRLHSRPHLWSPQVAPGHRQ